MPLKDQSPATFPGNVAEWQATSTLEPSLSMVCLFLPPFWLKNPNVWFAQVRAQFHLHYITSQPTRYFHVISVLPPKIADLMADVLAEPPSPATYDNLKQLLLVRATISERMCLQQLLNTEELADCRPSQLLHSMQRLLGCPGSPGSFYMHSPILHELFLQRLSHPIHRIVTAADDVTLHRLATLADRVANSSIQSVSAFSSPPAISDSYCKSRRPTDQRSRPRSPGRRTSFRGLSRYASGRASSPSSDIFWYHRNFRDHARRCTSPFT